MVIKVGLLLLPMLTSAEIVGVAPLIVDVVWNIGVLSKSTLITEPSDPVESLVG